MWAALAFLLACGTAGVPIRGPQSHTRRLANSTPGNSSAASPAVETDKRYISCSEQDLLYVAQQSAQRLTEKFVRAMDDLRLIDRTMRAENSRDGVRKLLLSADMCPRYTPDWEDIPRRTSAWAGYQDCDPDRTNDLWYGDSATKNSNGVFVGNRTIDTDLALLGSCSNVFPWIIERQVESFDEDSFYGAAWIRTTGEVWSYYPGFNHLMPGYFLGDFLDGTFDGNGELLVEIPRPEHDPDRRRIWSPPYSDPLQGAMISAITPVYFNGSFRGHRFQDEYIATMGIDILLGRTADLLEALKPTPGALPMVIDDSGRLIFAPQRSVAAVFGDNVTLGDTIVCSVEGADITWADPTACSINNSSTGDWVSLVEAVNTAPRGSRFLFPEVNVLRNGSRVPHVAAIYRWQGRESPIWNSVILVPQAELQRSPHWTLPRSIGAALPDPKGTVLASFVFVNDGLVDLIFTVARLPDWLEVVSPSGAAAGSQVPARFPAGASIEYVVRLDGSKASSTGAQVGAMSWLVLDDGYPDCFVQAEVVIEVTMLVPLDDHRWLLPVMISMAAFVVCLLSGLAARYLYQRRKQLLLLKKAKLQHQEEQLKVAEKGMTAMAFPMHVLVASTFCRLGQLFEHEVLRDEGRLKVLDTIEDVTKISFFFVSHQWTSWHHPDHSGRQFQLMNGAVLELVDNFEWHLDTCFVWVDFSSIPQRHTQLQQLAILSLPIYAAFANVFVIVAPEVEHCNTHEMCHVDSYMTRAWCRAEQMSHVVSRGFKRMYVATDLGRVMPVDKGMVRTALHVFEGSLTCCRLKHKGMAKCDKEHLVLPLLGVYAKALHTQARIDMEARFEGRDTFAELITAEGETFPAHFDFESETGWERRELFGDLVGKMKDRVAASHKDELEAFKSMRSDASKAPEAQQHPQHSATNLATAQASGRQCQQDDDNRSEAAALSPDLPCGAAQWAGCTNNFSAPARGSEQACRCGGRMPARHECARPGACITHL